MLAAVSLGVNYNVLINFIMLYFEVNTKNRLLIFYVPTYQPAAAHNSSLRAPAAQRSRQQHTAGRQRRQQQQAASRGGGIKIDIISPSLTFEISCLMSS